MAEEEYAFWMAVRSALLLVLDALEKRLRICPTTAEIRRQHRACK